MYVSESSSASLSLPLQPQNFQQCACLARPLCIDLGRCRLTHHKIILGVIINRIIGAHIYTVVHSLSSKYNESIKSYYISVDKWSSIIRPVPSRTKRIPEQTRQRREANQTLQTCRGLTKFCTFFQTVLDFPNYHLWPLH